MTNNTKLIFKPQHGEANEVKPTCLVSHPKIAVLECGGDLTFTKDHEDYEYFIHGGTFTFECKDGSHTWQWTDVVPKIDPKTGEVTISLPLYRARLIGLEKATK
jgi:hypothetical protein